MALQLVPSSGGASYLPTHIGGPRAIQAPSLASSISAVARGVGAMEEAHTGLGSAVANFGMVYEQKLNERNTIEADSKAREYFRTRQANTSLLQGQEADRLLWKEDEWQRSSRSQFLDDNKQIPTKILGQSYDRYAQKYLDWSMVHMVQQSKVADENVRFVNAQGLVTHAAEAGLSIGELKMGFEQASALYYNDPKAAYQTQKQILESFLGSNAERNPVGTVRWWKANEKELSHLLGSKFHEGAKEVRRTRDWLEDRAYRSEVRAHQNLMRGEAVYQLSQKKAAEKVFARVQQARQGEEMFTSDDIGNWAMEAGLDSEHTALMYARSAALVGNQQKFADRSITGPFIAAAKGAGFTPERRAAWTELAMRGQISPQQYASVLTQADRTAKADDKAVGDVYRRSVKFLETSLNPKGLTGQNQPAAIDAELAASYLWKAVEAAPDVKTQRAMMDVDDPNSLVMQLAKARPFTDMDRATRAYGMQSAEALIGESTKLMRDITEQTLKKMSLPTNIELPEDTPTDLLYKTILENVTVPEAPKEPEAPVIPGRESPQSSLQRILSTEVLAVSSIGVGGGFLFDPKQPPSGYLDFNMYGRE